MPFHPVTPPAPLAGFVRAADGDLRCATAKRSRSRSTVRMQATAPALSGTKETLSAQFQQHADYAGTPYQQQLAKDVEAVLAAMPQKTRERLEPLVQDGTCASLLDFDISALKSFQALREEQQESVAHHLKDQKIFLINSRSKSGFLVAVCEKAQKGVLDVRGFGGPDPWHQYLQAFAKPKRAQVDLVPEGEWLKLHGDPVKIFVDISADVELRTPFVCLSVTPSLSVAALKSRLGLIGVTFPVQKMRLRETRCGFLMDERSLAFYNLGDGAQLQLKCKARGGARRAAQPQQS